MQKIILNLCILLFLSFPLYSQDDPEAKAREEAKKNKESIQATIQFGIDSDLETSISTLRKESPSKSMDQADGSSSEILEESPYNKLIFERISRGYSSNSLVAKSIEFFTLQRWKGAGSLVSELLQKESESGDVDVNVLLNSLDYVRHLKLSENSTYVQDLLTSDNPVVVQRAIDTLAELGQNPDVGEELLSYLSDPYGSFSSFQDNQKESLRVSLIQALGKLKYDGAADELLKIVEEDDGSSSEWGAAARALGDLDRVSAIDLIVEKFRSGDSQARYQAIYAMGKYPRNEKFVPLIMQGLQESFWRTREAAVKACADLKLSKASPSLAYKLAHDPVQRVRREALRALKALGGMGEVKDMILNKDLPESVRLEALLNLSNEQDTAVVGVYRSLLEAIKNKQAIISKQSVYRAATRSRWAELAFIYQAMLDSNDAQEQVQVLTAIRLGKIASLGGSVSKLASNSPSLRVRKLAEATLVSLNS